MNISLEQALQAVDLEPGQTYRCQVRGNWVVLKVLESQSLDLMLGRTESLAPQEAWVELPELASQGSIRTLLVPLALPDVPAIPNEDEQ
jgi:hypothetical protein